MLLTSFLLATVFSLSFDNGNIDGVKGKGELFDGFTSKIVVESNALPALKSNFTVDVWFCPVAFPKCPCPIVCQQNTSSPDGYNIWLDVHGKVHFQVACNNRWIEAVSQHGLELRKWNRITCAFMAGKALCVAINQKEDCRLDTETPSINAKPYPMWIGRTPVKTPSFYENKSIPIYASLDGILDELNIYEDKNSYNQLLKTKMPQPVAPQLPQRFLPSGPDEMPNFGAWYIPLKFYEAWDKQWRWDSPDVVVSFGKEIPYRVVFWKGISYAPCFVTERKNWMCNEFIERSKVTGWGCPESMSDKHADFSSIRILENTPARTRILWRNAPVGVNQMFPYQNESTGWGDWSEEIYTFYPDGTGVRDMTVWSDNLTDWYEWCQSLQVLHPNQRPEDVLDGKRIMSVANMKGESAIYGWKSDTVATQYQPTIKGANIQVTYLKSKWNPFLILDDSKGTNERGNEGPEIVRYAGKWSDFSKFPWRNHWPVNQDYVIGRYAVEADAPSHTYTATQYNAPYYKDQYKMVKLMLCGCSKEDASGLVPLAKSWLKAPQMVFEGKAVSYNRRERAYYLPATPSLPLKVTVNASTEQPAQGVCIVIPQWKQENIHQVRINNVQLQKNDYKTGMVEQYYGKDLVLWIDVKQVHRFSIELQ